MMALAIVLFTGGGIRYFGAQHDCGHATHFSNRTVNTTVGVILGAFTAHPFYAMRYNHNFHHRHIGNLDARDAHEVLTWTVAEYQAAGFWGKLFYRTYRSIPVIYFFGPIFIFFIRYRIPKNVSKTGWLDVVMQNGLMFVLWVGVFIIGGTTAFTFFMIANGTRTIRLIYSYVLTDVPIHGGTSVQVKTFSSKLSAGILATAYAIGMISLIIKFSSISQTHARLSMVLNYALPWGNGTITMTWL